MVIIGVASGSIKSNYDKLVADFELLPKSEMHFGPEYNGTAVFIPLCTSTSQTLNSTELNIFFKNHFRHDVVLEQSITMTSCS